MTTNNDASSQNNDDSNQFIYRQARLSKALENSELTALALNPGPSLSYLTGLHFHLSERPIVAIFVPHTPTILTLPELEAGKTEGLPYPIQVFPYGEDPGIGLTYSARQHLPQRLGITNWASNRRVCGI